MFPIFGNDNALFTRAPMAIGNCAIEYIYRLSAYQRSPISIAPIGIVPTSFSEIEKIFLT